MREESFVLRAPDGYALWIYTWQPEVERSLKGVVQIVHGMGEHAGRYADLAAVLNEAGYAVYAHDQRGHGRSATSLSELGHLGDDGGWLRVQEDIHWLRREVAQRWSGCPQVLFGHSMGTFLARYCLAHSADSWDGIVLSSPTYDGGRLRAMGLALARCESWLQGPRARSSLLQFMLFGRFGHRFQETGTGFDWLSRDSEEVRRYKKDPYCGFILSNQSLSEMLKALGELSCLRSLSASLPILVLAGSDDPLHVGLQAVRALHEQLQAAGFCRVEECIYPGGRHEMLHESNRKQVYRDIVTWLDGNVGLAHISSPIGSSPGFVGGAVT